MQSIVDPSFPDESKITNSDLEGVFKINTTSTYGNTIYFRNNDLYDVIFLGSQSNTASLAKNEFPDTNEVAVNLGGYFTVNADSNTTNRGPCERDAMRDFDVGANATLNLNSWEYEGTIHRIPEISDLQSSRNGNDVTVTWNTPCGSSSKVIWGYGCGTLGETATGLDGTSHSVQFNVANSVQFNVANDEGCVYFKAISCADCQNCPSDADTSDCEVDVKDIVISEIDATFNALSCEYTVTWTTNVKSSSKVYYGVSCQNLNNTATGAGNTRNHSVVCDVSGFESVFAFKVESENSCDSAQSSCQTDHKEQCIGQ